MQLLGLEKLDRRVGMNGVKQKRPHATARTRSVAGVVSAPDPRVAPVEGNMLAFLDALATVPLFDIEEHADVTTYRSGLRHPLFNGVVGGRFEPGAEQERCREVMAPFLEAGLPFQWWSTASSWSPALHRALHAAGAVREDAPGMHVDLRGLSPAGRPVEGLDIEVVSPVDLDSFAGVMCEGFELSPDFEKPLRLLLEALDPDRLVNVLATLDGEPVACGSLWITGETAGVYNIAVLDRARERGVGYAVTSALLDEARARGCTESVLQATRLGRPVYERLGYVEVCRVPQYVWTGSPAAATRLRTDV
jgi:GNAT superfamily N-acetyltransferase